MNPPLPVTSTVMGVSSFGSSERLAVAAPTASRGLADRVPDPIANGELCTDLRGDGRREPSARWREETLELGAAKPAAVQSPDLVAHGFARAYLLVKRNGPPHHGPGRVLGRRPPRGRIDDVGDCPS